MQQERFIIIESSDPEIIAKPFKACLELELWLSDVELQEQYPTRFFVVMDQNQKPVARVAATQPTELPSCGFIGLLEVDDLSREEKEDLLQAAERVLMGRGCKKLYTPINFSTWFSYRLADVENNNQDVSFSWEPATLPGLENLLIESNYQNRLSYFTYGYESKDFHVAMRLAERAMHKAVKAGYRLVPFAEVPCIDDLLDDMYDVATVSFQHKSFFTSISRKTFCEYYKNILPRYDFSPSFVMYNAKDELVGFVFAFINNSFVVVKSIAILKQPSLTFTTQPLSYALLYKVFETCQHMKDLRGGVSAYMESQAHGLARSQSWAHTWTRKYHLFEKVVGACE